jgi:hypothetical protein
LCGEFTLEQQVGAIRAQALTKPVRKGMAQSSRPRLWASCAIGSK